MVLDTDKFLFVERLKSITKPSSLSFLSDPMEQLSGEKYIYKGKIGNDNFEIKRKRNLFDQHHQFVRAYGKFEEKDNKLTVDIIISGAKYFKYYLLVLSIMYLLVLSSIGKEKAENLTVAIPFILLHAAAVTILPLFFVKYVVKKMQYHVEREFHYILKKD